jgi:hypothetical protein
MPADAPRNIVRLLAVHRPGIAGSDNVGRARLGATGYPMRRSLALLSVCWLAVCAERSNTWPLAFGMTVEETAAALATPLIYVSGRRGSEIFLVQRLAPVPGIYPVQRQTFLQFRRGRLTGWKSDWRIPASSIW